MLLFYNKIPLKNLIVIKGNCKGNCTKVSFSLIPQGKSHPENKSPEFNVYTVNILFMDYNIKTLQPNSNLSVRHELYTNKTLFI